MENKLVSLVANWLDDNGCHLATHTNADYHYLNDYDFNYDGYSSYPSSIEEAIEDGSIYIDEENCLHICEVVIILN